MFLCDTTFTILMIRLDDYNQFTLLSVFSQNQTTFFTNYARDLMQTIYTILVKDYSSTTTFHF